MKIRRIFGLVILLAAALSMAVAQDDVPGSKDHPLFTRMPGYVIFNYDHKTFDVFEFSGQAGATFKIEGRKTFIGYSLISQAQVASPLQIVRSYQNALAKIGGVVLFEEVSSGGGKTDLKLVRGTDETWVEIRIGDSGYNYNLTIVERAGMQQDVVANADAWKSDINATGHATVYGILFDTDKSDIKLESEAALKEIAKLLAQNPGLSVFVVGHTDSTSDFVHNMTLSEARAKAVVAVLTAKHSVAVSRLAAYGCGPLAPIASNDTEEGRAKNRRVELVKK